MRVHLCRASLASSCTLREYGSSGDRDRLIFFARWTDIGLYRSARMLFENHLTNAYIPACSQSCRQRRSPFESFGHGHGPRMRRSLRCKRKCRVEPSGNGLATRGERPYAMSRWPQPFMSMVVGPGSERAQLAAASAAHVELPSLAGSDHTCRLGRYLPARTIEGFPSPRRGRIRSFDLSGPTRGEGLRFDRSGTERLRK
jgi:hypothetical protein